MKTFWPAAFYATCLLLSLLAFAKISAYNKSNHIEERQIIFDNASREIQRSVHAYDIFLESLYAFYMASENVSPSELKIFYNVWNAEEKQNVDYYGWVRHGSRRQISFFDTKGNVAHYDPRHLKNLYILKRDIPEKSGSIILSIDQNKFFAMISKDMSVHAKNLEFSIIPSGSGQIDGSALHKTFALGPVSVVLYDGKNKWRYFGTDNLSAFLAAIAIFMTISTIGMAFRKSESRVHYFKNKNDSYEKELDEKNYFLNEMIENMPGIVFVKSVRDNYSFHIINKAAEKFFGFSREDMLGKTDHDFFQEGEAGFFRKIDESIMSSGDILDIPCETVTTKDGEMLCHTRKVPIYGADGSPKFLLGLAEDITVRKKNELELADYRKNLEQMVDERTESLRQATGRAEEASKLKSEFLATMSHEIRSPMSGVLGMAELLLDTPLSSEQKNLTRTILNSGEILMNIIEDILDFSKIEANKLELDIIPVNMLDIADDIGLLYSSKARDKALELVVRYVPGTEQFFYADPVRIRQIIGNLVNNAIKFTETGHIVLSVSEEKNAPEKNGDTVMLKFSVEDTGIGIEESSHEKIFGEFLQANASTTRKYGGTGLGLSICKRLVELMDGTISFESESGKGSVFHFTLPLKRNREDYISARIPSSLKGLRVLVVDDLPVVCQTLEEQLNNTGLICLGACSGEEALEKIAESYSAGMNFDIIMIDYLMPRMNGEILAGKIRDCPGGDKPCLIMLTAAGNFFVTDRKETSHFSAYISKPVRTAQLIETLSYVWEKFSHGDTGTIIKIDNQILHKDDGGEHDYKIGHARILLVEDSRLNQAFAEEVLNQLGCDTVIASNGQEAIEILKSRPFDLVLMDCQMPVMDGFEASRLIMDLKGKGALPANMPVIALTANAMKGDRKKCMDCGMDDYLSKPVRKNELKEKIYQWLVLSAEMGQTDGPDALQPLIDLAVFEESRSILKDKFDSMITCYIEDVQHYIGDIRAALTKQDIESIIRPAHTIKSTSKRMGALHVFKIAETMEIMARNAANNNPPFLAGPEKNLKDDLEDLAAVFEKTREAMLQSRAG